LNLHTIKKEKENENFISAQLPLNKESSKNSLDIIQTCDRNIEKKNNTIDNIEKCNDVKKFFHLK
jgi:hypothetical protein